jgi:hypothetical protein
VCPGNDIPQSALDKRLMQRNQRTYERVVRAASIQSPNGQRCGRGVEQAERAHRDALSVHDCFRTMPALRPAHRTTVPGTMPSLPTAPVPAWAVSMYTASERTVIVFEPDVKSLAWPSAARSA